MMISPEEKPVSMLGKFTPWFLPEGNWRGRKIWRR